MRNRSTPFIGLLLAATFATSADSTGATSADGPIVHEWGTFTSVAGPDGTAVEWTPLAGPNDLPCFVARNRFNLMMEGEIEATTLTEPYITLAEKKGCRVLCSAFYHGTEVASDRVDADTYRAFNRAVREAVRRIDANKRGYLHYFIDYHKKRDPEISTLRVEDLRESRLVVVDPAPIPADEMERTYEWVKSWGMLEQTQSPLELVNMNVHTHAHVAAE